MWRCSGGLSVVIKMMSAVNGRTRRKDGQRNRSGGLRVESRTTGLRPVERVAQPLVVNIRPGVGGQYFTLHQAPISVQPPRERADSFFSSVFREESANTKKTPVSVANTNLRKASSMGVPMLMLGMRLSWTYDSVRRLTKSTQKLSILKVAVSKCFDFSGLEVMRATLLVLLALDPFDV